MKPTSPHLASAPRASPAPMRCIECGRTWRWASERWRLKVLPGEPLQEPVPYCPDCHTREFERPY